MRLMFIFVIIFMIIFPLAGKDISTQLVLPWGSENNQAGLRIAPEGRYGPPSFRIIGKQILLLDAANHRIKKFEDGHYLSSLDVSTFAEDFAISSDDHYYFIESGQVFKVKDGRQQVVYSSTNRESIHKLQLAEQQLKIKTSKGNFSFSTNNQGLFLNKNTISFKSDPIYLVRKDSRTALVEIKDESDSTVDSFPIEFENGYLGSLKLIGVDKMRRIFISIDLIENEVPLELERVVRVYTHQGEMLANIKLPNSSFAFIRHDLQLDGEGNLYMIQAKQDGLYQLKWDLASLNDHNEPLQIEVPSEFQGSGSVLDRIQPIEAHRDGVIDLDELQQLAQVSPQEALMIADSYVQLNWQCESDNLTNGLITDTYGYQVRTPSWLSAGSINKVPYKWGGFQTIEQFIDGIANNKYAGDNYTSKSSGSPSAVGVDCSGFVSRCWELSSHYSTRMMDDGITLPYDSWDQVRPGDAAHIVGHVRLIVQRNQDGSIDMVESSGADWRVSYRTYWLGQLSSYTPRYYINMQGTPGNVPQPVISSLVNTENSELTWTVGASDVISGINLYQSADGENWQSAVLLPDGQRTFQHSLADTSAIFFKLKSVAQSDGVSESVSSDIYGTCRFDGMPRVLIVDGFDRTASTNGSWPKVYHHFAADQGKALRAVDIPFETVSNEAVVSGHISLSDYSAVFWILGDESTADETFSNTEQTLVEAYLQAGGNLFVSGSEIAWDLDSKGSTSDRTYFNSFLKASYVADDSKSYTATGQQGTPFHGLTLQYDDGSKGVYEEDWPDAIAAENGATVALKYANGQNAATMYSGFFPGGSAEGKLVYLAFPFETIFDPDQRIELTERIINFFELIPTSINEMQLSAKTEFRLLGNFPNPFNSSTRIQYTIPSSGKINLYIFNMLGQKIEEQTIVHSEPGHHSLRVDMNEAASGTYIYQIRFGQDNFSHTETGKFLLLK